MLAKLQHALKPGEPLLIGVSGGADSVALLDALVALGVRPHVCHLNHQWRGAASEADAEFVRVLAGRYSLPVTIEKALVGVASPPRPGEHHRGGDAAPTWKGLEDAGRQARLEFFQLVAEATGINTLALAHTADDQVETFLLRLLRGAGVSGLGAMWPDRQLGELRIIRPLVNVRRTEVLEYLKERKIMWREDASNSDTRFARNRIRHELLPLLEREYNPAIRDVLLRTAEILRDEDAVLAKLAAAAEFATLRDQPVALQRRALRLWLGGELDFEHIESVRTLEANNEVTLPGGLIVAREYDTLRKFSREEVRPVEGRWPVKVEGETGIAELGGRFVMECADLSALSERQSGDKSPQSKPEYFDADALGTGLFVRTWKEGDRFQPLGMSGEKKLQDFFVDEKVPRRQRGKVPLLCVADGRIAWVVGYRIAEPFKVTPATRRALRVWFQG